MSFDEGVARELWRDDFEVEMSLLRSGGEGPHGGVASVMVGDVFDLQKRRFERRLKLLPHAVGSRSQHNGSAGGHLLW